jgi:hypothetical protein
MGDGESRWDPRPSLPCATAIPGGATLQGLAVAAQFIERSFEQSRLTLEPTHDLH